jgi:hypothetical protein
MTTPVASPEAASTPAIASRAADVLRKVMLLIVALPISWKYLANDHKNPIRMRQIENSLPGVFWQRA